MVVQISMVSLESYINNHNKIKPSNVKIRANQFHKEIEKIVGIEKRGEKINGIEAALYSFV